MAEVSQITFSDILIHKYKCWWDDVSNAGIREITQFEPVNKYIMYLR